MCGTAFPGRDHQPVNCSPAEQLGTSEGGSPTLQACLPPMLLPQGQPSLRTQSQLAKSKDRCRKCLVDNK